METLGTDYVKVRLSGSSDKLYTYLLDRKKFNPDLDDRVVLPSKLKSDGTISLCIGTVEEVGWGPLDPLPEGGNYKPVVAVVPKAAIEAVRGYLMPPITGSMGAAVGNAGPDRLAGN